MATIKDVANKAQVSVGTVSNVLNGKTKNLQLVKKVEDAMHELAYYPDVRARNLKKHDNSLVGVIITNLQNPDCISFLAAVDSKLRENNFGIFLKLTKNNFQIEKKCVEQCLEHHVNGIIIYSPFKDNVSSILKNSSIPSVLISEYNSRFFEGDTATISYDVALKKALTGLQQKKITHTGLIMESELIYENNFLNIYREYYPNNTSDYIKSTDGSQERGFITAFNLFYNHPEIEALIVSNYQIAKGVIKALKMLNLTKVFLIVIKESNWIEDNNNIDAQISVSFKTVGNYITNQLLNAMKNPEIHENIIRVFQANYEESNSAQLIKNETDTTLQFELVDSPAARALKMLSTTYAQQTGININFDLKKYQNLEHDLYDQKIKKSDHYDGFMVDVAWMDSFADQGILLPLNELKQDNPNYFAGFVDGMIDEYGTHNGNLIGIPFLSGAQILFYRKDLFEDKMLKYNFRLTQNEELIPPKNWATFNLIAKYFTRAFNHQSPVEYGISNVSGPNISTTISFLNRLWAYGSDIFDNDGDVIINNKNTCVALQNFKDSYKFTSHEKKLEVWEDVAKEFSTGNVAMCVLYNTDAVNLNDYSKSQAAGNIGFSLIPDNTSVLSGWCLSINPFSKNVNAAKNFILWACSIQNTFPFSLLGGSTLRSKYYKRDDLENIYPWKSLLPNSYKQSRKRIIPVSISNYEQSDKIYTSIIPTELEKFIAGDISVETTVSNMEQKIITFIENHKNE